MKYGRRTTSIARQQAAQQLAEQNESDWTDWLPAGGAGIGAGVAALSGVGLPAVIGAAALGGQAGGAVEMLASGPEQPARMGRGAVGLAQLAGDEKSAEIIKKILRGWGSS
jgi:hypothetical protein